MQTRGPRGFSGSHDQRRAARYIWATGRARATAPTWVVLIHGEHKVPSIPLGMTNRGVRFGDEKNRGQKIGGPKNVGTDGTFPMYHTNNWGTSRLSPVFQNHNYLLQALTVRISLEPESTTMSTYRQEVLKQLAAR